MSSYSDCLTVMMKLVSLPLICIQSGTEIIINPLPDLPQLLQFNFTHSTIVLYLNTVYINMRIYTQVCQLKENKL